MHPLDGNEHIQQAVTSALRALTGNPELEIGFGGRAEVQEGRVVVPRLPREMSDLPAYRGLTDALALRVRHHDSGLHQRFSVPADQQGALFEAFEDARVAVLGGYSHAGVAHNLVARLEARATSQPADQSAEVPPIAYECWLYRTCGLPQLGARAQELADRAAQVLAPLSAAEQQQLAGLVQDQIAFARAVREALAVLGLLDAIDDEAPPELPPPDQTAADGDSGGGDADAELDEEPQEAANLGRDAPDGAETVNLNPDDLDPDAEEQWDGTDSWLESQYGEALHKGYRVYTTAYDEEVRPLDICSEEELHQLRGYLDDLLRPYTPLVSRLANRLQRLLMSQQERRWEFDLEEGILNTARLVRVVIDPGLPLSFKRETETEFRDTLFSLLIDCSGSMRGRSMAVAAMCADVIGATLERCGLSTEILGFTSREWKGGQARTDWEQQGKPANPGRLNDLRHIVFKSSENAWRRCRRDLGLMMREGLLKENIDGEALLWAHERLVRNPACRRILMVISDGAPVDDSTLTCNGSQYLDNHLQQVIAAIEGAGAVELVAIGIGHDVRRYYRRAVMINTPEDLGEAMAQQLTALFS